MCISAAGCPAAGCPRLPPQLNVLTSLKTLNLDGNGLQQMSAAQLQGMLACMPRLTQMRLDRSAASSPGLDAVLALERTYPNLEVALHDELD